LTTFSLDSFHPDTLRCDKCGHGFTLPGRPAGGTALKVLRCLTVDEVALAPPGLAADVQRHAYTCLRAWFPVETWDAMTAAR
jgi:hypothetical protein